MKEIFKDVVGYEGIYEVSNYGRIRTHKDKTTTNSKNTTRKWQQRYLKDKTPNGRNVRVELWKNGKSTSYLVHRIVAQAFIPMIYGKQDINHIDGNPKNNRVDNLEWCNHLENNRHAYENGLIKISSRIKLTSMASGEEFCFESMAKASAFINKNVGYISGVLARNRNDNFEKVIIVSDKKNNKYVVEEI